MPESQDTPDLERFRPYLSLLARAAISRRWARKFDASDIVQDTLVNALRAQGKLRGRSEAEIAAWLRRILERSLVRAKRDLLRQRRDARREVSIEVSLDESAAKLAALIPALDSTPSKRAMREERAVAISRLLEEISDAQREAIVLTHFEGLSVAEAAEAMQRTPVAVASLLRHGLARLRELVGDAGEV
jgi:RNA polymerase sigma-70 factor (ECF subfamily)